MASTKRSKTPQGGLDVAGMQPDRWLIGTWTAFNSSGIENYRVVMAHHARAYAVDDLDDVLRIVRETPWATFVSDTSEGLRSTQYPVLLDQTAEGLILRSHFCGPDVRDLEVGDHEMLVIVNGPNGYVSPSWYPDEQVIPTWDFVTVHLHGIPEIVSDEENFAVLQRMVDQFEAPVDHPRSLSSDPGTTRRVARATTGLRMRVTSWSARAKLSQNKPDDVRARIVDELRGDGPYANPALAQEMEGLR